MRGHLQDQVHFQIR